MSANTEDHEDLPLRAQLGYGVAILIAKPDIILRIDCHAMRFFLVADHIVSNRAEKYVIGVELEQLRFAGRVALKGEQVTLGIYGDGRDSARQACGQGKRV